MALDQSKSAPALADDAAQVEQDDTARAMTGESPADQHTIQFLDLHTNNPIVSYKGQAYSCTWTDLIGTSMFFSSAKETPLYDPEISTNDYDVIGTSRIKLVGNPVKVTPKAQHAAANPTTKAPYQEQPAEIPDKPGKSLGTIRTTSAKNNADLRKQANFLEQLMNVKRNRGEKDNVQVVMNSKLSKTIAAGKLKFMTQRREDEIDQLNRRIVRGDGEALRKLEHIYAGQDEDSDEDASAGEELAEVTEQPRDDDRQRIASISEGHILNPAPDDISAIQPADPIMNSDKSHNNDKVG